MQAISGLWHTDKVVSPKADTRYVLNFGPLGGAGIGTSFRFKQHPEVVFDIVPPAGAGMRIGHELTLDPRVEHKHTGNGNRSLSVIIDGVRVGAASDGPTMQALADAAAKQRKQPIDFDTFKWDYDDFKGSWRKGGVGGGSVRRCAVSGVAGPVQGGRGTRRDKSLPESRAVVAAGGLTTVGGMVSEAWGLGAESGPVGGKGRAGAGRRVG